MCRADGRPSAESLSSAVSDLYRANGFWRYQRCEFMTVPFYKRALDSFSDDIIVRIEQTGDGRGWQAVLDVGLWRFNGDPDFAVIDLMRDAAVNRCAKAIRDDAAGIGPYAPHTLLSPSGYDFHHRLCRHWATKEYLRDLGHDPNQFVLDVDACLEQPDRWRLKGSFLDWSRESRVFEAGFRLALVDLQAAVQVGNNRDEAVESFWHTMETAKAGLKRTRATEETWALVDARLTEALGEFGQPSVTGGWHAAQR